MGAETDSPVTHGWQASEAKNDYSSTSAKAASCAPRGLSLSRTQWLRLTQVLRLSGRECEITRLILELQCEDAIAVALSISPHTVHSYLERLYRKTAVRSRAELIIKVFSTYIDLTSVALTESSRVVQSGVEHDAVSPGKLRVELSRVPDTAPEQS